MRYIFLLFFFVSVLFSHEIRHKQEVLDKVSLQLHWKYQFQFAGFIAAKEKGFYKDAGLDVEFKPYTNGMDIVNEVTSKRATYGIYNSNILLEYLHSKSIKLIASYFKRSALILITKPKITSVEQLVNKTIMTTSKEDFSLNFKPLLDKYNVDIETLKFKEQTYNIKDFSHKDIDAMTAFISDQPYKLKKLGIKYNILNPSDFGPYNLQLELFTSNNEALKHPKRVERFREASKKGWEYALEHKDEIIDLIYKKYSKNIDKLSLQNEAKEIEKLILPKVYSIGSIEGNYLFRQYNNFRSTYDFEDELSLNDFIFKSKTIYFTNKEKEFLQKNQKINVCIKSNIFPIDGISDGKHSGIMGDVFNNIAEKLGVEFQNTIIDDITALDEKLKGKKCDIISILPTDNGYHDKFTMSESLFSTYFTLISKLDKSFIKDSSDLEDKTLMVQSEFFKQKILETNPKLKIIVEYDMNNMMKSVLKGEVYSIVVINEVADFLIDKYGYGKLKINGFLSKENIIYGGIATIKEKPVLAGLIQKALDHISQHKIDLIVKSWRLTRYHKDTDYSVIFKILFPIFLLMLVMIYYQRKLKKSNKELASKIEELKKKDRILTLQSKQAVMGEMISMIAHQWRQPLSNMTLQISNFQLKKMLNQKILDEDLDKVFNNLSESAIYLSNTIDDFKTFFHPDKQITKTTTYELFEKVHNFSLPKLNSTDIKIDIDKKRSIILKTYTNELIQVLLSILNNAIDAFEGLEREEKQIKLYAKRSTSSVYLYIEDNGSGIKQENLEKLFEPYFSTKGKNGTGLGLYMSQMIIQKQFQGDIEVQTSENGSIFIIKVPLDVSL